LAQGQGLKSVSHSQISCCSLDLLPSMEATPEQWSTPMTIGFNLPPVFGSMPMPMPTPDLQPVFGVTPPGTMDGMPPFPFGNPATCVSGARSPATEQADAALAWAWVMQMAGASGVNNLASNFQMAQLSAHQKIMAAARAPVHLDLSAAVHPPAAMLSPFPSAAKHPPPPTTRPPPPPVQTKTGLELLSVRKPWHQIRDDIDDERDHSPAPKPVGHSASTNGCTARGQAELEQECDGGDADIKKKKTRRRGGRAGKSTASRNVPANCAKGKGIGDDKESKAAEFPLNEVTTVMLRNIPNRYTPEEMLCELLVGGFEGTFDYFYLPIDFQTKRNRGYGFVNFRRPEDAAQFTEEFYSKQLTRYPSRKILEVSPALTQGLEKNVLAYYKKDSQRIQNPWFRPMIFDINGEQADVSDILAELSSDGKAKASPQKSTVDHYDISDSELAPLEFNRDADSDAEEMGEDTC